MPLCLLLSRVHSKKPQGDEAQVAVCESRNVTDTSAARPVPKYLSALTCAKADAFLALSQREPQLRCPLHTSPCQAAPDYAVFEPKSDAGQDLA